MRTACALKRIVKPWAKARLGEVLRRVERYDWVPIRMTRRVDSEGLGAREPANSTRRAECPAGQVDC